MKKIVVYLALLCAISVSAQDKTSTSKEKSAPVVEQAQKGDTLVFSYKGKVTSKSAAVPVKGAFFEVKGVKYPIYLSKNGKAFIIRTSAKTGNQYNQYLSDEIATALVK